MDEIMEPVMRYTINVGDFTVGDTVYPDRCLSASGLGQMVGVDTAEIPWADSEYNPWDYHYIGGEFVLEPIELPEPEAIITQEQRIAELEAENAELQDALLEVGGIIAEQDEHNAMLEDAILELAEIMGGM